MGHIARILAALAILVAGVAPLAAFDGPTQTTAPKKKAGPADKPADETPKSSDDMETLRRQMKEMQEKLDRMSKEPDKG